MSLLKPNSKTLFHIDFEWWQQNERDWHVFLRSFLCPEHQELFANVEEGELVDWIDPKTAEVKPVDGVQHALISHCAQLPEFVNQRTAMVEAIFRLFLANGNIPMSVEELSQKLEKPASTILRTIAGPRVYRGLRPILSQPSEPA
ncbi:MAG: hypothetical protein H6634_02750 [Anaerolineales bacterium]|nr:hypothetical protein [Anaerolineales bacterium]MCB9110145.1 hypothetical protein [Anaerolineales bacterium]